MKLKDLRSVLDQFDDHDRVEVTAYPIIEVVEAEIAHARALINVQQEMVDLFNEQSWEVSDSEGSVELSKVAQAISDMIEEQLTRYLGSGTDWMDSETSEFTVEMVSAGIIHIEPEMN